MRGYDHTKIEKKWQKEWAKKKQHTIADKVKGKDNFYLLVEFPYPSGNLHVGHWYAFAVPDILARHMRMQGKNVMYPIGFDAFGLPAENAAIKNKLNPRKWTYGNITHMEKQIESMGTSFDWSRKVVTADPDYYRWTQWLFLQFFKKGLAYKKETAVNWCPNDKTVLANEQVVNGACERCGAVVEQRSMLQWNLKITDYADRLVDDLTNLDWPQQIKESQKNWIGRSHGADIPFQILFDGSEKTRYNYILLHGKGGSPESDFLPWLKSNLEARGYTVQVPRLPNTDNPNDEEQADYVQKNCTFDEKTVVVGHLFGGIVALRLLERGIKVQQVSLIATPFSGSYADGKDRPTVTAALRKGFDSEKIKTNASGIVLMYDTHDHVVPLTDGENMAKLIGGQLFTARAEKSHFNAKAEPQVLAASDATITVFTTRPDTLFGATYIVLSPEHLWITLALKHKTLLKNNDEVQQYVNASGKKTELERQENKEKTGVKLEGVEAVNPATGKKIPMYVADYVLAHYGTGAIMSVPAHDERDLAFAQKFGLPIIDVIEGRDDIAKPFVGEGKLINSNEFNGLTSEAARDAIAEKYGAKKTTYKMRDWVVSRQRYWGVPIPIIHCAKCGDVAVPEKDLPVKLPEVKDYLPTGDGKSPLAKVTKFMNTKCPVCGGKAERETDTFDTFVDSSWYFQRYTDPKNKKKFADAKKLDTWMPVDLYSGGAEHTTMHLLYSRFWHKAMYDLGLVAEPEPYTRRMNRSLIMGPDGQKMSKSRGNVIDPDEVVKNLGADTVRMYLAFIGPYNEVASYPWNPDGVVGVRRFIERVWRLQDRLQTTVDDSIERMLHECIKKVGEDIALLKFNTAIAAMMSLLNAIEKTGITKKQYAVLLRLLAPFAPHTAEELWHLIGNKKSVHLEKWPTFDAEKAKSGFVTIAIQVNGKLRGTITCDRDAAQSMVESSAAKQVNEWLGGKQIRKIIYVPQRLINFVID